MSSPRWTEELLRRLAPPGRGEELVGDLEEAHRRRVVRRGHVVASVLTGLDALDMAAALLRERLRRPRTPRDASGPERRSIPAGPRGPRISWLDFKIGVRMLARYPGLTVIGGLAMAFGIALGAGGFQFVRDAGFPTLPGAEERRLVEVWNVDTRAFRVDPDALHDFVRWREELTSVQALTATHYMRRNLSLGEGASAPVAVAATSWTAFDLVRVPPLLGRPLVPEDEVPGAAAVALLGFDLWEARFGGAPDVVGRVVLLGGERRTVVGVMPEGFAVPFTSDLWVPFRLDPLAYEPGAGPDIMVIGRLAPGATLEEARAEVAALGERAASDSPDTHGHLRAEVAPYPPSAVVGISEAGVLSLSALALAALMAILCGNVAVLFFARAAAREAEIAVRSALGASRGRIVAQLFAEALVLAGLASAVGLLGASAGLRWVYGLAESAGVPFPFWMGDTLSPATMGYAVALALVGAVVAGALPGVKVTGRRAGADLQRLVGRGSRAGLGRFWTGIIVFQVALSALFVPVVLWLAGDTWAIRTADPGLPAEEYLVARLEMDGGEALGSATEPFPGRGLRSPSNPSAFLARYEEAREALGRRLAAESGVRGVTFARQVPGGGHPSRPVEVDAPVREASVPWRNRVQNASVDPGFFDVMGAPILAGRGFLASDLEPVRRVVVVNESFVREFLGSRNAVGRRIRYPDAATGAAAGAGSGYSGGESAPWHEIVGVVRDLAMTIDPDLPHNAGVYHPLLEETYPVSVAVHVAGEPGAFTGRLRELAMAVDPGLRIERPFRLDGAVGATLAAYDAWFRVSLLAVAVALLLTAAGIYSTVSFTVSRRTREIGVRVALGADRWQVVRAVVSRTLRQVTLGVLIGVAVLLLVAVGVGNGSAVATGRTAALVLASMALMLGVSMLACLVPTRRALAIEPTEALSADG